jgi:hypothetical protein
MDSTTVHFANRCLPLLIANQHGWFIVNKHHFLAVWNGKSEPGGVIIYRKTGATDMPFPATSHFGYGVLTFNLNYLFRTPPGYNLWIKGPANWPKDGITPLEGIVETDWTVATFTMNWKITTVNRPIEFEPGEPICMIVPVRRGEIESFAPEICDISEEPELGTAYAEWSASRAEFNSQLRIPGSEAVAEKWQKDYMSGLGPGVKAPQHQVKLALRGFVPRRKKENGDDS